ncbi:hypothetical protein [Streptomyces sp. RK62]|uniref:hypothetical protein n=1 Tax=Streptomyces sp. RK62 TaxID=2824893 RepID=UPI001B382145|nr:hypothetical protein [Streptomyces sp. RK62]MBQ0997526.1 hypothetical protein [Streptomyces sp. RK62]
MMQTLAPAEVWFVTPGHHFARFPAAHGCGADVALVDRDQRIRRGPVRCSGDAEDCLRLAA